MLFLIKRLLCLLSFVLEHVGTLWHSLEKSPQRIVFLIWQLSYYVCFGGLPVRTS